MPLAISALEATHEVRPLQPRRLQLGGGETTLHIGLLNNMPDAAVLPTQRQFSALLDASSDEFTIVLSLWTLDSLARSEKTRGEMSGLYESAKWLHAASLDAIIVTGAEPRAASLEEEPYWDELTGLIEWSRGGTFSMLASCLAAHVAIRHEAGVQRRRLAQKRSGLYVTDVVRSHQLTEGIPVGGSVPHSRWNGVDESDLAANGYLVLRSSSEAGVDLFIKDGEHLQVFLQGHPEYDADTLAREYRRDLMRALQAGKPAPALPVHYFDEDALSTLREFSGRADLDPSQPFPDQVLQLRKAPWRKASRRLFRNWLAQVAARKSAARTLPVRQSMCRA
jgi:homoserine O-succinyltransferase/O-acetyltransferase